MHQLCLLTFISLLPSLATSNGTTTAACSPSTDRSSSLSSPHLLTVMMLHDERPAVPPSARRPPSGFNNPTGAVLGLLSVIQTIGTLAPYVSDILGRKNAVLLSTVIMVIATAIQSTAQSGGMFISARLLGGMRLIFAANAAPMLLISAYNSLWYSGNIIGDLADDLCHVQDRQHLVVAHSPTIQRLPSVLQICFIWFVPESPRYLVSKGRDVQALQTLAYYHADGDKNHGLVRYEFDEIKAAIKLDRTVNANVRWKSLVATPGNRRRMRIIVALAFFSQWSGNGLVSYYLNEVLDQIGSEPHDPAAHQRHSRYLERVLGLTSLLAREMFIFFLAQTICIQQHQAHETAAAAHGMVAFIFLFYAVYDLAFTLLIVSYTVEILPCHLCTKGFNVFNFFISLALIFNQYVNPITLAHLRWKYYLRLFSSCFPRDARFADAPAPQIVYVVWLAFECGFIYFNIVETKNLSLKKTAALFDSFEAVERLEQVAHVARGKHKVEEDVDEKGSDNYSPPKLSHV
ncbi:hypothetical protein FIBSPDRAFT_1043163 [Athelia psychrophila]|uniref:MFS general substrate transporter n=1 Tax=Athelia psychrophila TaxID=1759441 RepID=A0A166LJ28_9AGAM|nr:hypothetical protein FIBSPDRAFT_1043163 [Fibularhizoctonia sp. CBS 109695]